MVEIFGDIMLAGVRCIATRKHWQVIVGILLIIASAVGLYWAFKMNLAATLGVLVLVMLFK
jgi:hypothetical protein